MTLKQANKVTIKTVSFRPPSRNLGLDSRLRGNDKISRGNDIQSLHLMDLV